MGDRGSWGAWGGGFLLKAAQGARVSRVRWGFYTHLAGFPLTLNRAGWGQEAPSPGRGLGAP